MGDLGTLSYVPPAPFARRLPAGPDADAPAVEPLEDWHPEDALLVPMRSATGHLLGIVSVDEPIGGHRPSDAQLEVLSAVCGHAALAVEHAQATDEADHHRAAVQHLLRVSARLTGRRSVEEMLFAVGGGIRDALGFQRVIVSLTEGPDHRLRIRSSIGWSRDELAALPDVPVSAISRLLRPEHQREGCVLLAREEAEVLTPPEMHGLHRGQRNGRGPCAWREHWLLVPLHDRDGAFTGIIWADEPGDRLLPATEDLQALRAFANQAIGAVESGSQLERLRELAEHDPLTGLRNRRGLEQGHRRGHRRARDGSRSLVCDLDHFKRVNDMLGHEARRRRAAALRRPAARLHARLDVAARLGGEEFALVLPGAGAHAALAVAERLRHAVRERVRRRPGADLGLDRGRGDRPRAPRARRLLRAADRALYTAKRLGRDRCVVYDAADARRCSTASAPAAATASSSPPRCSSPRRSTCATSAPRATRRRSAATPSRPAAQLGWSPTRVERVRAAGVLHDIGKLGIPDAILLKPGALDGRVGGDPPPPRARRPHPRARQPGRHRRAGSSPTTSGSTARGYPPGLAGAAIPAEARILAVADAYEAMTADRPYRPSIGASAARADCARGAGSQFDADVVDAFIAALADGDDGLPARSQPAAAQARTRRTIVLIT